MRLVAWNRTLQFRLGATCGKKVSATERASFFAHGASRDSIRIGDHGRIDGTVEVYDQGELEIGSHFFLGRSRIYCSRRISIGNFVLVSDNVSIMDSDLHPMKASARRREAERWARSSFPDVYSDTSSAPVRIGNDVWIGFGATVLKGVSIGEGAIIGAGALVTSDVAPWSVVVGAPAREVRRLGENER